MKETSKTLFYKNKREIVIERECKKVGYYEKLSFDGGRSLEIRFKLFQKSIEIDRELGGYKEKERYEDNEKIVITMER